MPKFKKPKINKPLKGLAKNFIFILLIFLIISGVFALFAQPFEKEKEISIDQLAKDINQEKIKKITAFGSDLSITYKDETEAKSRKEPETGLRETLISYGASGEKLNQVNIDLKPEKEGLGSWLIPLLIFGLAPLLIFGFFFWMIFRRAKAGATQAFSFTKARARLFGAEGHSKEKITFKDVADLNEAKEELKEIVDFLKHPKKYLKMGARIPRGVLLMGPAGTGKCIVGNSLVLTNKGLIEIKDIQKYFSVDPKTHQVYGAKLLTVNVNLPKDQINNASHWYDLGEQSTIKVTLKQGFQLEGTPEHPVVILNKEGQLKFKKIKELKENDYVAIKFGAEVFGSLKEVNPQKAYIMGLLTGDGNLSHSNRIGLTTTDEEINKSFRSYIQDNYGEEINIGVASDGITQTITSWKVKKDFYNSGMSYLLSYDKTVPFTILQAPKETVVAFLQGLFDSDGYFEKYNVGFATVSKKMSDQILMMLLNLGIVASRRIKSKVDKYHKRPVYEIIISGAALKIFEKQIGFQLSRKKKLLEKYLSNHKTNNTNVDIFPYIADKVEKHWRELSRHELSTSYFANQIDKIRDRNRISRRALGEFLDFFKKHNLKNSEVDYLRMIYNANLFFLPVLRTEQGKARVYDFTVPKSHSFISNGFISHNTLLARAVAGEANVPFFSISGSEFVEMFVGVGAGRVRDLFSTAKKAAPSIIFIDELDAIGRQRGAGLGGGHDEREQTLNQILVEMDGFERETNVIIISATNRPDILDSALLRPGRFDRKVVLDMPDINGSEKILEIHCKGKPLASDVNLREVAERTPGFSGADAANVVNESAILAARRNKTQIDQEEFLESIEKVLLGPERKSHILSKKEKEIAAFHEAGHALVSASLPGAEPVRKISIIARGMAAGYTLKVPTEERKLKTKKEFLAEMATLLGGYCAEKIKFGEITTGAGNDLKRASGLARKLVKQYGMSSLGPISFGEKEELVFLGKEISEQRNYSEEVASKIDKEVEKFVRSAEKEAIKILTKRKKLLNNLAQTLIKKETIEREEFERIVKERTKKSSFNPKLQRTKKTHSPSLKVKIKDVK